MSGLKYTVLISLVKVRRDDAWALLNTGMPLRRNGAVYLGGYSVECALKARVCRQTGQDCLEDCYFTHDFQTLAKAALLLPAFENRREMKRIFLWLNGQWNIALRYKIRTIDPNDVETFLERCQDFSTWLLSA